MPPVPRKPTTPKRAKLEFIEQLQIPVSLRASAHTGVAIRIFCGSKSRAMRCIAGENGFFDSLSLAQNDMRFYYIVLI